MPFASNLNFIFMPTSASLPGDASVLDQSRWKKEERSKFTCVGWIFQVRVQLKYNLVERKRWRIRRALTESESLELGCLSVNLCSLHGGWPSTPLVPQTHQHQGEHSWCDVSIPAASAAWELTLTQADHRIFLSDAKLTPRQDEGSTQTPVSPAVRVTRC